MDWDKLRVFLAVARAGQILGAARRLGLNHATVARQLDALEAGLGTMLVERGPSGCTLTAAGERLAATAERMEAEALAAEAELAEGGGGVSGTVRVGAPDGLGNYFLAPELARLASLHPGLVVELVPLPRTFSLSKREADVAIGLERPGRGRLVATKLTDYTLGVYATRDYLAAHGEPASKAELAGHVFVSGVDDFSYSAALDYAAAFEGTAAARFHCASVVGQVEAIRAGHGFGIVHDYVAARLPELVPMLPEITFRRSYWLVTHPDTSRSGRVATVTKAIAQRVREERRLFAAPGRG
jgi:DNA-binding transcriptional LysR family regulator